MRMRHDTLIGSKGCTRSAQQRYGYPANQEVYVCSKRCRVFGLRLGVAVTQSKKGELVVLVCNADPDQALRRYPARRQIEFSEAPRRSRPLLSALKSRGFNLEDTHMTTS